MFVNILKRGTDYDNHWLCSSSLCYDNFCAKTETGYKIKYRIRKNTETQRENTEENTENTTEINWH